jgi:hypothetical protein
MIRGFYPGWIIVYSSFAEAENRRANRCRFDHQACRDSGVGRVAEAGDDAVHRQNKDELTEYPGKPGYLFF